MEKIAFEYASLNEGLLNLVYYGVLVLGGAIGGYLDKTKVFLLRVPFFVAMAMIFLAVTIFNLGLLYLIVPSAESGFFWFLLLIDHIVIAFAGAILAHYAKARSRDIFGHSWGAILAFIPLIGLYLLLKESRIQGPRLRKRLTYVLRGGVGVFVGFAVALGGAAIRAYTEQQVIEMQTEGRGTATKSDSKLEKYITAIADSIELPRRIDDITTLVKMRVDGVTLIYSYEILVGPEGIVLDRRMRIVKDTCKYDFFVQIIKAGGEIKHEYVNPEGASVGEITVASSICGF
ncbi:MAG: hypothetical protein JKY99_03105 [Rhizobiales bacterium]|nr:hypothetical protein [Hyphomicrobiales bacterium]